ncbi:pilus assembly protein PilP [Legionella taurinensis]|uniref:Pilus assembly protein PilP n=1 Tax=Legionella taurinensis TaxID=70611 RepID=A0A3A5L7Z5_9GAMM|nr:pilus assembly protein PilP [Legionella taurinensis]MDX1836656.1 pilus assembly protein PilP [Legionella taurinensis]PUT42888.1 pilus assembly protein PilP [Legionella taurinensis]PUT45443.1 pilus assembly protein PilP [Legionella taurinensis]PUT46982.1 pilus assembly protein PilP [Legionella taurinensis]PUT49210.1 pilus assembly protein PilP [Legionella taurinensis]
MTVKRSVLHNAVLLSLAAVLAGCTSSADSELTRYINEIKSRPGRPIEPIPQVAPLPKFTYPEVDSRRSPFKPKEIKMTNEDKLAPNTNRPKQPLEQYPLDSLKFVGVLKENETVWGLISKPDGEIVRVKPGDYMGQNFGKVISISNELLKLEETTQIAGKWKKQITTINLNAPQ